MQYGSIEGGGRALFRNMDAVAKQGMFTSKRVIMGLSLFVAVLLFFVVSHKSRHAANLLQNNTINLNPLDVQATSYHDNSEAFVNQIEAWFEMQEMDGLPEDTYEGQGMSTSGIRCNEDLPQYSPSACNAVFDYVNSMYSLELKGLAQYLIKMLDGSPSTVDSLVPNTQNFGVLQTEEMNTDLNDHPMWFLNGMESFGGGGGAGFQVFCRGVQLLTAGGGGGGGFETDDGLNSFTHTAGGGGGVQIFYKGQQYSVGGGENHPGTGKKDPSDPDWSNDKANDPKGFYGNMDMLLGQLQSCPRDQIGLWFGGGGGGGVTIDGKTHTLGAYYFYRQFGKIPGNHKYLAPAQVDTSWCTYLPTKAMPYTDCPPRPSADVEAAS